MSARDYMKNPFDTHQCLWTDEETHRRCRAFAEHNKFFCCQHNNDIDGRLTIIPTRAFHLPTLDSRENLQAAITLIAERLAARYLDDRTAKLLLKSIHYALQNLQAQKKEQRQQERENPGAPGLASETWEEPPQNPVTPTPAPTDNGERTTDNENNPVIPSEEPAPAASTLSPENPNAPTQNAPTTTDNVERTTHNAPIPTMERSPQRRNPQA